MMKQIAWACLGLALTSLPALAQGVLTHEGNMAELNCRPPDTTYRFLGSNAPSQVFLPGESVDIRLALKKGGDAGRMQFAIEIQPIGTRTPGKVIESMKGFSDTAGHAPIIDLVGDSVLHRFDVTFDEKDEKQIELSGLSVPDKFGTYALVLVHGEFRQFLGTVCRVRQPRENGTLDNTPVFGEAALFDRPESYSSRAAVYARMGIRGMRSEASWSERRDGSYDWAKMDPFFAALKPHGIRLMITLGAHPDWLWPFAPRQTPASVGTNWDGSPYGGQSDWLAPPSEYARYGKWITAFCERYWEGGNGALWGLENYNEPWEGGGISGWARDCIEYRKLQKLIAESAWKVDRGIKICAASSIMNTEDKLYSDGSREFDKYIDVFSDHYVKPAGCYGPMVARAHGKESVETETWFVGTEYMLPQVAQFLASGQLRLSPWHPRALFDSVPGVDDRYFIPTPVVSATAAFNYFVTGRPFEKMVFKEHLPWVFQFGKDNDVDALLVLFGQLTVIGGKNPKDILWSQVNDSAGGTLTINNADGLLQFYDLAGNPIYEGQTSVTLPLTIFPTYITCARGPALAAERLAQARMRGKRPVEILPRDFNTRITAKNATLRVGVHNCLNRIVTGTLTVSAPNGVELRSDQQRIVMGAGQAIELAYAIASAKTLPSNAYPFEFHFAGPDGEAKWSEMMHVAVAPQRSITVDGNLRDWDDVPGVTAMAGAQEADAAENARRPWLELKDRLPDGSFMEFKLAWDTNFLYIAARVNDMTPAQASPQMAGRDENRYFHSAASDEREPYSSWLAKHAPGRSFAEVPYVYADSPERPRQNDLPVIPFRRDRLHIALDVTGDWHDLEPTTDRVPAGFHAVPDTDYEYSLHLCRDGKSELWRLNAPGVARIHDFPRQPRGKLTTGSVKGARHVAKLDGKVYTYEAAIPRSELRDLALRSGTTFGLMVRAGNDNGPHVDFGADKAVTKQNGLTLKPYWESSPNCGVRWTLVD